MNFIENLTLKKGLLIFLASCFINFGATGLIYFTQNFPLEINEYQKIADFVIKKFEEKNMEVTIKKDGIQPATESYFIESEGFPVSLIPKNILYINKSANYADFKEKDTIAILNDKELVLNLNNEYQNLPLESLLGSNEQIVLNKENVRDFINKNYLENNQLRNLMIGGFVIDRIFNYFILIIWGYLIMGYSVYFVFKFSGYILDKKMAQSLSLLFFSFFTLIQPLAYFFNKQINLVYIYLLGFLVVSIFVKQSTFKKQANS